MYSQASNVSRAVQAYTVRSFEFQASSKESVVVLYDVEDRTVGRELYEYLGGILSYRLE